MKPYDVLVVGGGINGVGIARDAALRDLRVALVESHDLASATSSYSSKLIHGGLRYLEQYAFGLVRKSLIERTVLYTLAPHLVYPARFHMLLANSPRPKFLVRLGLFLYDLLAGKSPFEKTTSIAGGYAYTDCRVDDARLVVLNAVQAQEYGATILTRTACIAIEAATLEGTPCWAIQVQNTTTQVTQTLYAKTVVNAAGPWVEAVQNLFPHARVQKMKLVKGSHILVPKLYEGTQCYTLQTDDGRIVFTLPYEQKFTLIGTTDVPFENNPRHVHIDAHEQTYLCHVVNQALNTNIQKADIVHSYSGVRPLIDDGAQNASKITRDYRLELAEHQGLPYLAVYGGKLTTYRVLAEQVLEKICGTKNKLSATTPLPGGDFTGGIEALIKAIHQTYPWLETALVARLCKAYGTRVIKILGAAKQVEDLGQHFGAGLYEAEVKYLQQAEWAKTADDILWRRTKLGLHMNAAEKAHLETYLKGS